jgi:hypothetical protein
LYSNRISEIDGRLVARNVGDLRLFLGSWWLGWFDTDGSEPWTSTTRFSAAAFGSGAALRLRVSGCFACSAVPILSSSDCAWSGPEYRTTATVRANARLIKSPVQQSIEPFTSQPACRYRREASSEAAATGAGTTVETALKASTCPLQTDRRALSVRDHAPSTATSREYRHLRIARNHQRPPLT